MRLPRPPTHSHFVYEHWQRRMRMLDHPTIVAFRVVVALILELRCALMRVAFRHLRAPSHAISFRARCFATLVGHGLISAGLGGVRELRAELCPASARSAFAPSSQRARGLSMSIVSCPSLTSDSIAFVVESQDSPRLLSICRRRCWIARVVIVRCLEFPIPCFDIVARSRWRVLL